MSDVIAAVLVRQPPPLRGEAIPPALQHLVAKALAKNPAERYQNAAEMASELRAIRQELGATPAPAVTRLADEDRSPRRWLVPAVLALVILMFGSGWIAWRVRSASAPLPQVASPPIAPASRSADFWLTVQRGEDGVAIGEPFDWNGNDPLGAGWGFRLNFLPQSDGHLYVFNQGADDSGNLTLRMLFPRADGKSASSAYQTVALPDATHWFALDRNPGKELLWIAWSTAPIELLERATEWVKGPASGDIRKPQEVNDIQFLLGDNAQQTPRVEDGPRRALRGDREILVTTVRIERR